MLFSSILSASNVGLCNRLTSHTLSSHENYFGHLTFREFQDRKWQTVTQFDLRLRAATKQCASCTTSYHLKHGAKKR